MKEQVFRFQKDVSAIARSSDPETSHISAALVDMAQGVQNTYWAMYKYGEKGCVADDIERDLDIRSGSNNPRYARMIELGMIELTGKKRRGHICGGLQIVRRVLEPPFIRAAPVREPTINEKKLKQIQIELNTLNRIIERLSNPEDKVRMRYILRRLEGVIAE